VSEATPVPVTIAPTETLAEKPNEASFVRLSALRHGITVWGMVGHSEELRKLQDRIRAAASSELSVLIIGETGSGKELVANAIHQESRRSRNRFVAVNTGAVPRELVASELFGHIKGSFTGALKDRDGCFVEADGGTLFLDELATMDERTQVGLLRALEQKVIQPVGSNKEIAVNVRIVAATNCNLLSQVRAGNFREDLYYRLESFVLVVPPLRQRRGDIPELAAFFADKVSRENGREILGFTPEALRDLSAYDWPGNIRELRNAVSQAVVLTRNGVIDSEHLPDKLTMGVEVQSPSGTAGAACNVGIPGESAMITKPSLGTRISLSLDDGLNNMVQQIMQKAVEVCGGNVTLAAQILGISRKTIYNRLRLDAKSGMPTEKDQGYDSGRSKIWQ
jgi:DNA-binding NtrC family response regulator